MLLICMILSACGETVETPEAVAVEQSLIPQNAKLTVWYVQGDPIYEKTAEALSEYCGKIKYKAYESNDSLLDALALNTPDAVICDVALASKMEEGGYLKRISVNAKYNQGVADCFFSACTGYFPIGVSLYMTVLDSSKYERKTAFTSFDVMADAGTVYAEKNGEPFYALESTAVLFQSAMNSENAELKENISDNIENDSFVEVYNLLADGIFTGSFDCDVSTVEEFAEKKLACGVFSSVELNKLERSYNFLPMSMIASIDMNVPADIFGIAVCAKDGTQLGYMEKLIGAITEAQKCTDIALSCGCMPAVIGGVYEGDDSLYSALMAQQSTVDMFFYTLDANLMSAADSFEENFIIAMGLLN